MRRCLALGLGMAEIGRKRAGFEPCIGPRDDLATHPGIYVLADVLDRSAAHPQNILQVGGVPAPPPQVRPQRLKPSDWGWGKMKHL
jgi:hypothetical protein